MRPPLCSIESSHNRSVKIMLDLPHATHRALIEPLTGQVHVKLILIRKFLSFMEKIKNSGKLALKILQQEAIKDVRSVTGSNYRNIMILAGEKRVEDINVHDSDKLTYFKLGENDVWKVKAIKEIIDTRSDIIEVPGFEPKELEEILCHLCTT